MSTILTQEDIVEVNHKTLFDLREAAEASPQKLARLCLHRSHDDPIQEMVICYAGKPYPPHRHEGKTESFHIIEGRLLVFIFDDDGNVTRRIHMAPPLMPAAPRYRNTFLYRLSVEAWHAAVPMSDYVILHEATTGPFVPDQIVFPEWGPDPKDPGAVEAFFKDLI